MRNRPQTKNDGAWEELFETYQIAAAIERDGALRSRPNKSMSCAKRS